MAETDPPLPRAGLARAGPLPLIQRRLSDLYLARDDGWRLAFEAADVMSEGCLRDEAGGAVYYGWTSIVLPLRSMGGPVPDDTAELVSQLLGLDPHARLRALRLARTDAVLRAGVGLSTMAAELTTQLDERGPRIDVDVSAPVAATARRCGMR